MEGQAYGMAWLTGRLMGEHKTPVTHVSALDSIDLVLHCFLHCPSSVNAPGNGAFQTYC